jgi:hypothetical protein
MELVPEKERVVSEVARTTNHSRHHEADYDRSLRTDVTAIQRGSVARGVKWEPPKRTGAASSFPLPGASSMLSTSNKHRKNPPFSTTLQPTIPALKAVTKSEDDHLLKWARNRLPWTPPSPKASSNGSPISVRDDDDNVEVQEVNVELCGAQHPGALVGPLPLEREIPGFALTRAPNRKRKTTAAATRDQALRLDSFLTDLVRENRATVQAREEAAASNDLRHGRQRQSSEPVIELIDDEPAEMPEESPSGASGDTIVPPHPGSNLSCDTLATLCHDYSLSSDSTLRVDSSSADNVVQRSRSSSLATTLQGSGGAVMTCLSIISSLVALTSQTVRASWSRSSS